MAEAAGGDITAAWIGQVERGEIQHPAHYRLSILAKVFGISVEELLGEGMGTEPDGDTVEEALIIRYRTARRTKLTSRERREVEETLQNLIETILRSREGRDEGAGQGGDSTG